MSHARNVENKSGQYRTSEQLEDAIYASAELYRTFRDCVLYGKARQGYHFSANEVECMRRHLAVINNFVDFECDESAPAQNVIVTDSH